MPAKRTAAPVKRTASVALPAPLPMSGDQNPAMPWTYQHRLLVTIAGMTPQVLTETLYALAVKQQPRFVPTRIVVLTTTQGAKHARLTLLGDEPGWLSRLCRDYGLEGVTLEEQDIRVLQDAEGQPLSDIRSVDDNAAAGDSIFETIRELTSDPDAALHVSMAGGRKTMGFFAGYALSVYGRPQDRCSHVLVKEGFENNTNFFYPTPNRQVIYDRDGKPLDAKDAEVTLADIPLVMLRNGIPAPLLSGSARMSEVVRAVQQNVEPPRVVIDLRQVKLVVGDRDVPMSPQYLAFYAWVARGGAPGRPYSHPYTDIALAGVTAEYRRLPRSGMRDGVKPFQDADRLFQTTAQVNKEIRRRLADHPAANWSGRFLIQKDGPRGKKVYRLSLPPSHIIIIEP